MKNRRAFTLIEVLFAAGVIVVAILPLLWMTKYSNQNSMDAYYELLGMTLAKEPIVIFQALGYNALALNPNVPHPDYPIGEQQVPGDGIKYPVEASAFKRKIQLEMLTSEKAARVTVSVYPSGQSRVSIWTNNNVITMEGLIFQKPR
ncbi:MAG: prepilin-type N-terminal cleavage/methylation domain-containing protein [Candidatus Riflebacteria bacterium]|nr:prepilin-type N-terminal cleavage/methylation domain-containing protein [Candidatus Riflebacteria bacterium]